ncbi:unnamed protein product [Sphagnum balticum]
MPKSAPKTARWLQIAESDPKAQRGKGHRRGRRTRVDTNGQQKERKNVGTLAPLRSGSDGQEHVYGLPDQ